MILYYNDYFRILIEFNNIYDNTLFINFIISLFGAGFGAYFGYLLAKRRDEKNEYNIFKNIIDALILESENNKKLISEYFDPKKNHWDRKKTFLDPISIEVYKTFQSMPVVYNYTSKYFLKQLNIFYTKMRQFKKTEDGSEANRFININKDNFSEEFNQIINEMKKQLK